MKLRDVERKLHKHAAAIPRHCEISPGVIRNTAAHGQVSAFSWAALGWVMACLLAGAVTRSRRLAVQAIQDRAEQPARLRPPGRREAARQA